MEGLNSFESHNQGINKSLEDVLWQRAEEFSVIRQALQKRIDELEALFQERPTDSLNLHERKLRIDEETEYWETKEEIWKIVTEENKLETALISLNSGAVDLEEIRSLIPEQTEEEVKLSKRKRAILEEKERLEIDPRDIMSQMYGEFGSEKMHLTTGRHATGVKNLGSVDPLTAASEFYYRTVDTHGGKVAYGKRGNKYVSRSGKRVRKY